MSLGLPRCDTDRGLAGKLIARKLVVPSIMGNSESTCERGPRSGAIHLSDRFSSNAKAPHRDRARFRVRFTWCRFAKLQHWPFYIK